MIERFTGADGRRVLVESLKDQTIVRGNKTLAEKIADVAELIEVPIGASIIEQDADSNDLFFILAGFFDVSAKGHTIDKRKAGEHVGEMAAVEPSLKRSATVTALEKSVVCKIDEPTLSILGSQFPDVWRSLAKELAQRLSQRNALLPDARDHIRVFLISSAEGLEVARAVENAFERDTFKVHLWTHGTFRISEYPVESLELELNRSDFAIAIVQPDDVTHSRGTEKPSPRDNVIFELGLYRSARPQTVDPFGAP